MALRIVLEVIDIDGFKITDNESYNIKSFAPILSTKDRNDLF